MAFARLLRIWKNSGRQKKCTRCHTRILVVIDDRGKSLPFRVDATPLREEKDAIGRQWQVFEPTAFHPCSKRSKAAKPTRVAAQPRLL